ncbi:MAG: hypothetical protein OXB88_11415 [Bacteriovoracales bacterium]|nr:hypothetical protein [Bacteriovoracales bacterium]
MNLKQTQRICGEYKKYYNCYRPHQGISGKRPEFPNKIKSKNIEQIYQK